MARCKFLFVLIAAVLLAACSGQSPDSLPLTVVALQGTPYPTSIIAPGDWLPTPGSPLLGGTPVAALPDPVSTPVLPAVDPTSPPSMPEPVLPAFTFSPDDLVLLNGTVVSDVLQVDLSALTLVENTAAPLKLIPDSELVYGPAYVNFDTSEFVSQYNGRLKSYRQSIEGQTLTGPQVVDYVARQYGVGPRVLLALLEHSGGWVTQPAPDWVGLTFPMGYVNPEWGGLQAQLTWAANRLNYGYYGWKQRGLKTVLFADDTYVFASRELNAGTLAVQTVLGLTTSYQVWEKAIGPRGFLATYRQLFGDPFVYDRGVTVPDSVQQPVLELPWAADQTWYYSGGPHGGWGGGSASAAVDFIPPDTRHGCYDSDAWVTASAAGLVVRTQTGLVVVDLDGDGFEQTGWVLHYLHIAAVDKVGVGTRLRTGDAIGHPSCEGGVSTGTHVHFARRYNGEWIPAGFGRLPMVLSGWTVGQGDRAYNGTLARGDVVRVALDGRSDAVNSVPR